MRIRFIVTVIFFFNICLASAQDESFDEDSYELFVPDTFNIVKARIIRTVSNLREAGRQIVDSIGKPPAYIIKYDQYFCIGIKKKNSYVIFDPFEDIVPAPDNLNDCTFERKNFDGKGSMELVIHWQSFDGNSSWRNGMHEGHGGIAIWNLDDLTSPMIFESYYSYEGWWNEYAPDETDSLADEEREVVNYGSSHECSSYEVTIDKKIVRIKQTNRCVDLSEEKEVKDDEIKEYRLTKLGLVRKKI